LKLNAVAEKPGAGALDQTWKSTPKPFDGIVDFLRIDVRGGVLEPALEDIDLVQQGRLIPPQTTVRDECLENLIGARAPMWKQSNQAASGARLEDLDVGLRIAEWSPVTTIVRLASSGSEDSNALLHSAGSSAPSKLSSIARSRALRCLLIVSKKRARRTCSA